MKPDRKKRQLTELQILRKTAMMRAGKNQLDIAAEIAKDGKPCTRQAVEGVIMDRWGTPSERIAQGFAKAVGMPVLTLFPALKEKRALKAG